MSSSRSPVFDLPVDIQVSDGDRAFVYSFDGRRPLTMGRADDCDIFLTTAKASRHHAEIVQHEGRLTLVDQDSANGTLLNGASIQRHALTPGDEIRIGTALLVVGVRSAASVSELSVSKPAVASQEFDLSSAPRDESAATAAVSPDPLTAAPREAIDTSELIERFDAASLAPRSPTQALPARAPAATYRAAPVNAVIAIALPLALFATLGGLCYVYIIEERLFESVQSPVELPTNTAASIAAPPTLVDGRAPRNGDSGVELDSASPDASMLDLGEAAATADLKILGRDAVQGVLGWELIERAAAIANAYPGTTAAREAERLRVMLSGVRQFLVTEERAAAESALTEWLARGHYGAALAASRFLAASAADPELKAHWSTRSSDIDQRARREFHELERNLSTLIEAGDAAAAVRTLANTAASFGGTSVYAEALPRYVESGLSERAAIARGARDESVDRVLEDLDIALAECRFRDLEAIYYKLLALDPPAELRLRAFEGLVDSFYMQKMFADFLEGSAAKEVVTQSGKLLRSTETEVEFELQIEGHPYREIKSWRKLAPLTQSQLFHAVVFSRDGLLGLALFNLRIGNVGGAEAALVRLHNRAQGKELAASLVARLRGIPVPESGFVEHKGRLVTPAEKSADVERTRREREEARAFAELIKKQKLAKKLSAYIEHALDLRKGGSFELAHDMLREISVSTDAEAAAEARRLLLDPLLREETLLANGPPANSIDVALLGEGYPVEDEYQAAFLVDANRCLKLFLNEEPYKEYQSYFNFYAVQLGSRERGCDKIPGDVKIDSALDGKVEWGVFTVDNGKVMALLDRLGERGADRQAIVIGKCDASVATGGGGVSCLSAGGLLPVGHEFGHSFGALRDEYDSDPSSDPKRTIPKKRAAGIPTETLPPNLMAGSDREDVLKHALWHYWIEAGEAKWWNNSKVSVFEGGDRVPFNVWRPQSGCKMRDAGARFCVVCMEVMVLEIYRHVRPIDRFEPESARVAVTDAERQIFKVWPKRPATHDLEVRWYVLELGTNPPLPDTEPEGKTVVLETRKGELLERTYRVFDGEGKLVECVEFRARGLRAGWYRIRVEAHDPTPWVLRDEKNLLWDAREWFVEVK
ncbi:MAG: M64 family metallopeptidase [Planctomycetota bacterium]